MEKPKKKLLVDGSREFKYRKLITDHEQMKKVFIQKHKDLEKEVQKARSDFWNEMERILKEDGLLSASYKKDSGQGSISYEIESLCVFHHDPDSEDDLFGDLPPFIKKIIKIDLEKT